MGLAQVSSRDLGHMITGGCGIKPLLLMVNNFVSLKKHYTPVLNLQRRKKIMICVSNLFLADCRLSQNLQPNAA